MYGITCFEDILNRYQLIFWKTKRIWNNAYCKYPSIKYNVANYKLDCQLNTFPDCSAAFKEALLPILKYSVPLFECLCKIPMKIEHWNLYKTAEFFCFKNWHTGHQI